MAHQPERNIPRPVRRAMSGWFLPRHLAPRRKAHSAYIDRGIHQRIDSSSIHPVKLERTRRVTLSGVPDSVRLLLVGSNGSVRRGLELLLSGEAGVEIVGRAESANSAIRLGRELSPSTVLIDLESLGDRGLEGAVEVRCQIPATVIVLSLRDDQQSRQRADEAGLRFVSKQAGSDGLLALLRGRLVD